MRENLENRTNWGTNAKILRVLPAANMHADLPKSVRNHTTVISEHPRRAQPEEKAATYPSRSWEILKLPDMKIGTLGGSIRIRQSYLTTGWNM